MNARALAGRVMSLYPVRLGRAYARSKAASYAAGLAFNMFMSMFPLMLGLLAVVGLIIRDPHQQAQVSAILLTFFPANAQEAVQSTLTQVRDRAGILGIIGILGLLWSGSSLFTGMEFALGEMFGAVQRDFVRQRLMAFCMTAAFVLVIVVSVFANAALAFVRTVPLAGPVAGAVIWVTFMLAIYRVVPNRTFSTVRQVWPGALVAGLLTEALTLVWPVYTGVVHGFTSYGSAFALFFLLATWLYFLSQFILLGAIANRMRQGEPEKAGLAAVPQEEPLETPGARAADEAREQG